MSEAVATINTEEVERAIAPVVQSADTLVVANVDQHQAGMEMLAQVMKAERKVKAFFAPALEAAQENKRKAEAVRQEVVAMQDRFLAPVLTARRTISDKCAAFEREEREAARRTQEALQAEAMKRQEEQRVLDAAMAATDYEAEDALTAPLPPPVVAEVKPLVAKVAGVSSRRTWAAEITDKAAFLRWVIESGNLYMVEPNMVQLNSRARAERDGLSIPGVKAVEQLTHVVR